MGFKTSKIFIIVGFLAMQLIAAGITDVAGLNMCAKPMKWLGTFSKAPSNTKNGDAYHNSTDNKSYVMDNNKWSVLAEVSVGPQGPQGPKGNQGKQGLTGATGPQGLKGDPGSGTAGTKPGDMQYWDGTQWVMIPVGTPGQVLTLSASSVPRWSAPAGGGITDADGNIYHAVTIGTQTWMVENLKTTRYNDGTPIPLDTNTNTWGYLTTGAYCWYNNDSASNKNTYGALYNWYAVNTGKLAPTGWHVPSDSEWETLGNYLGGDSVAGGPLKESGTAHWLSPNTGATNSSDFSALPGGEHHGNGVFYNVGYDGFWWSSTAYSATGSWARYIICHFAGVYSWYVNNADGFSVRCVKD